MNAERRSFFLARPWWRDFIVGYLCIGFGLLFSRGTMPVVSYLAAAVGIAGVLIVFNAPVFGIRDILRRRPQPR